MPGDSMSCQLTSCSYPLSAKAIEKMPLPWLHGLSRVGPWHKRSCSVCLLVVEESSHPPSLSSYLFSS